MLAPMTQPTSTDDPIARFAELYARAAEQEPEPTAVALATADREGNPAVRMLLLKHFDDHGFVLYTNHESRKGRELHENPRAALCFFWKSLETQVRVEGPVTFVDPAESDAYFASRPRESRLGAWASLQSQPLESREVFEARIEDFKARYGAEESAGPVPRPPHWGGFRVVPHRVEFWFGHRYRLHDRFLYTRSAVGEPWTCQRLYP
mgnify:CR=1 FL=1